MIGQQPSVKRPADDLQGSEEEFEEESVAGSSASREQLGLQAGQPRRRGRKAAYKQGKLAFKCAGHWLEDHKQPLFGCAVNSQLGVKMGEQPVVFATVGANRVSIYQCEAGAGAGVQLLQCYADPDSDENFYTCAWSYDPDTYKPLLAAAGARGIVRLFSPATMSCIRNFVGHGMAVNEVKFHPKDPNLLLSVSKDHALRLWNVKTEANIVIFGGVEGHRDEVLSADFNMAGTAIVSCGMDHSLKVWKWSEQVEDAVQRSYKHDRGVTKKSFSTLNCHFPDFSTRDIHRNYVDCCRWFGDFILSKSCENSIVCWKAGSLVPGAPGKERLLRKTSVIQKLDYKDCEIWFVRFCLDHSEKLLAMGNMKGKIYVWDLEVEDPTRIKPICLTHPKCDSVIRQTSFSRDGRILIAVCDDGTIWRWDRQD